MSVQTHLAVPYADTRSQHLRFSLTTALQEPLASCDHRFGRVAVSLRLLGASHQVVVDDGSRRLCETVACLPDITTPLPASFVDDDYAFTAHVEACEPDRISATVADLTRRIDAHAGSGRPAVLGHFPGSPLAVTAVIGDRLGDTVTWQTWHTYPQSAELVVTTGELRLPRRADR
ncbi:DUF2617 family protein [Gordonia sp. NPDC003424]